jgi:hypothetical protein
MPEPNDPTELVKLTVYVTEAMRAELKVEAAQRRMTISAVIIEALMQRQWITKKGEP